MTTSTARSASAADLLAAPALPVAAPRRGSLLTWAAIGALVWVMTALFSLATAPMSSPDEPSHAVRAAAVARTQWSGVLLPAPDDIELPGAATLVRLPADWAEVPGLAECFAFDPVQAADCQVAPGGPADDGLVDVPTYAGQYPPLYYALVGWPSLFLTAWPALTAMRLVSATLTAGFLTWGLRRLATIPGNRAGVWGAALALSPMVFFLGATINPAGFEIVAAFSFWAAALALVSRSGPVPRSAMVQAAVSGAVLVNSRFTGPVWAIAIVALVLLAAPAGRWREVLRDRAARWVGLAAVLASAAAVSWLVVHPQVVTTKDRYPQFADPYHTVRFIVAQGSDYLQNMIGDFGWLDTPVPALTWLAWYVATGTLILLALSVERGRRRRLAVTAALLATATAPIAFQLPAAVDAGVMWQGRYALPLAVGVPLIAALVVGIDGTPVGRLARRVARASIPLVLVAHVAAFTTAARRYAVGVNGEYLTAEPAWTSPVGYATAIGAFALVATALAAIAWRFLAPRAAAVTSS